VSLGIVRPDPASVRFKVEARGESSDEDQEIAASLISQTSLIEAPLRPLATPEYSFRYTYKSGGKSSSGLIHDWEVQAAYDVYRRRYGDEAIAKLTNEYQIEMPRHNLHLFLGTMKAHPAQFIIVGLLRTSVDVDAIRKQGKLFA
jgi:hypothetical protein